MWKNLIFPKFVKKWCSKSRYVGFWIFVFKKCNFSILQKLSTLFLKLTLCMGKNEIFLVFFHSFSQWLTSRNFTFSNHFYHSSEWHPPPSCCWENVKKCQTFTYWFFDKNSKILHYTEKMIFSKFSKKIYIWGFWRKFPKICRMFRG